MPQMRDERIKTLLDLWTRFRDFREQYLRRRQQCTTLRQRFYRIECAWCKKRIGWKRKTGAVPGATSHSICPQCAADIFREVARQQSSPHSLHETKQ
jgi:hypothetical protein